MENVPVLRTYSMLELLKPFGPAIHQLLIYLLSFLTVPSRLSTDIDLTKFLETTGLTLQTVGNYMSMISKISGKTTTGASIPLITCHSINYEQQSLELELNEQYLTTFSSQFSHPITIPETMLCLNTRSDYAAALRLAIWIANTCHTRRGFAFEIKVPMSDFLDGYNDSMRKRWRSTFLRMICIRFDMFRGIGFFDSWFIIDIYGDKDEYIHLNSKCRKADMPGPVKRLTRSWARFVAASIVFELSDYWK